MSMGGRDRSVQPQDIRRQPRKLFFKFLWLASYFRRGYFCSRRLFVFKWREGTNVLLPFFVIGMIYTNERLWINFWLIL